uniref:G-protein coupled receptors family 1 profile domain-containing protein n=1 Tax=Romanomermis culicivorax TaxID=13658 RepID=A0A915J9T9_ROMCU
MSDIAENPCTNDRSRSAIFTLIAFACCWNLYVIFVTEPVKISKHSNRTLCTTTAKFTRFVSIMNYADFFLTLIVPFFTIIGLNMLISMNLLSNKTTNHSNNSTHNNNNNNDKLVKSNPFPNKKSIMSNDSVRSDFGPSHRKRMSSTAFSITSKRSCVSVMSNTVNNNSISSSSNYKDEKITKTLLIVSTIFLIMNFPDHFVRLIASILHDTNLWSKLDLRQKCILSYIQMITNVLFQTNFAVNFFLYSVVGRNFRRQTKIICATFWVAAYGERERQNQEKKFFAESPRAPVSAEIGMQQPRAAIIDEHILFLFIWLLAQKREKCATAINLGLHLSIS